MTVIISKMPKFRSISSDKEELIFFLFSFSSGDKAYFERKTASPLEANGNYEKEADTRRGQSEG